VLRDASWRLPGFARASLPYLHANFLSMHGAAAEEPGRIVITLGRPPLSMVLAMTGMQRAVYRLPWLGERPVALFPEGIA
jgi:hypothetical protein